MNKATAAIILSLLIISLTPVMATTQNLVWDANGNLITGDGKYRIFNGLNQLTHIFNGTSANDPLLETYKYHPVEERIWVKKVYNVSDSSDSLETVIYINQNSVRVINDSGTFDFTYVYHNGQLVAQNVSGITHYTHTDHGGTSQVVTNSTGGVLEYTDYEPFGSIIEGGEVSRYDYRNKEYDSLVGDYDLGARRYNAEWARFTQPDTIIPNPYNPQTLNRYSYALNNPYKYQDSTGHYAESVLDIGFIIADIYSIAKDPGNGWNYVALAADVAGLALPFVTGGGLLVKAAGKVDDAYDAGKYADDIIDTEKIIGNEVGGFADDALLAEHFGNHGDEFGSASAKAYESAAKNFMKSPNTGNIQMNLRPNGEVVKYDTISNTFGVIKQDGTIKTFMKPDDAGAYYRRDLSKHRGVDLRGISAYSTSKYRNTGAAAKAKIAAKKSK